MNIISTFNFRDFFDWAFGWQFPWRRNRSPQIFIWLKLQFGIRKQGKYDGNGRNGRRGTYFSFFALMSWFVGNAALFRGTDLKQPRRGHQNKSTNECNSNTWSNITWRWEEFWFQTRRRYIPLLSILNCFLFQGCVPFIGEFMVVSCLLLHCYTFSFF